jgi:hypothetical protein
VTSTSTVSAKIANGKLSVAGKQTITRTLTVDNRSKEAKSIVVEAAKLNPDYELVSPTPAEKGDTFYRFVVKADAGKAATLKVTELLPELQEVEMTRGNGAVDSTQVLTSLGAAVVESKMVGARIAEGALIVTNRQTTTLPFVVENGSNQERIIKLEVARGSDDAEIVSPAPTEKTATSYFFTVQAPAGKKTTLNIVEAEPTSGKLELVKGNAGVVDSYIALPTTPAKVREGLVRVRKLWKESDALTKDLANKSQDRSEATAEEVRIRSNVTASEKDVEFHGAQIKKLQETEDKISALNTEIKKLREAASAKEEEITQVVGDLKVE